MLFVWPEERSVTMWMKDVPFDLDAVFIDEDLRIVVVHAMKAQPGASLDELVRYRSGEPVKYVLEIAGGLSRGGADSCLEWTSGWSEPSGRPR